MMHTYPRMRVLAFATATHVIAALGGCAPSVWNGTIEQWGSMRAA